MKVSGSLRQRVACGSSDLGGEGEKAAAGSSLPLPAGGVRFRRPGLDPRTMRSRDPEVCFLHSPASSICSTAAGQIIVYPSCGAETDIDGGVPSCSFAVETT